MDGDRRLVGGETLVDLFPSEPGGLAAIEGFHHRPGGAPANLAVCLARLDAAPLFWTRVGDDEFGSYLARRLAQAGISDRFVVAPAGSTTALVFVTPTPDGDRAFTFYETGTATLGFVRGTVPDDVLEERRWVHASGVPLARPAGRSAVVDLLERARDADATVTFDPNARPDLFDDPATAGRALREALSLTDVVFCSPEDLLPLDVDPDRAREAPTDVAGSLLEMGPHTAFLTLGERGTTVATESGVGAGGAPVARSVEAFDVDPVDTTGAGDAFAAAAISRYRPGATPGELERVLRYASAAAALTTTATGGMDALPTAAEIASFLDERGA
jgi:fructokinase